MKTVRNLVLIRLILRGNKFKIKFKCILERKKYFTKLTNSKVHQRSFTVHCILACNSQVTAFNLEKYRWLQSVNHCMGQNTSEAKSSYQCTKCDFFFPRGTARKFSMSVLFVVFSLLGGCFTLPLRDERIGRIRGELGGNKKMARNVKTATNWNQHHPKLKLEPPKNGVEAVPN